MSCFHCVSVDIVHEHLSYLHKTFLGSFIHFCELKYGFYFPHQLTIILLYSRSNLIISNY